MNKLQLGKLLHSSERKHGNTYWHAMQTNSTENIVINKKYKNIMNEKTFKHSTTNTQMLLGILDGDILNGTDFVRSYDEQKCAYNILMDGWY